MKNENYTVVELASCEHLLAKENRIVYYREQVRTL